MNELGICTLHGISLLFKWWTWGELNSRPNILSIKLLQAYPIVNGQLVTTGLESSSTPLGIFGTESPYYIQIISRTNSSSESAAFLSTGNPKVTPLQP